MAEGEVADVRAVDVQRLRLGVPRLVVVGGGQRDDHLAAGGDRRAGDLHRLDGVAERRVGHRGVVAEELLHGGGDAVGLGPEQGELVGVAEQGDDAVADEAGRRVVAGHDQLEDRRQQLLVGEPFVAVAGLQQPGDQVVARRLRLGLDQRAQHRHDRIRRRLGPLVLLR